MQTKLGNNKKTKLGNNKKTKLGNNKNNKKGFHELTRPHYWHGNLSNKVNKQNHKQTNKPRQERKKRKKGRPTAPPESKHTRQQTKCQQNAYLWSYLDWSCLFVLTIANNSKAIARRWFIRSNCFERYEHRIRLNQTSCCTNCGQKGRTGNSFFSFLDEASWQCRCPFLSQYM